MFFDRAVCTLIAAAAACAAVAVGIVAAGFALYAVTQPVFGNAGAAATVALIAFLIVLTYAFVTAQRARARERAAMSEHAALVDALPRLLGDVARDHPLISLAVSVAGGALAARHPQLTRDLLGIAAAWSARRPADAP